MKFLIICNNASGLSVFRGMLIKTLISKGNAVEAIIPITDDPVDIAAEKDLTAMDCYLHRIEFDRRGMNPVTDLKLMKSFNKVLKISKPDFVITYTIKANVYGGFVCQLKKIQYVANITGLGSAFQNDGILKKIATVLNKLALKKAKTVFFENVENRDVFVNLGIVQKEKACVLNGAGVDLDIYGFKCYPSDEEIRFLFIGRIMAEKGIDEFFDAAKRIKKEYSNVFFDIVGPYEDDYKEITEQLVYDGVVEYHGYQANIKPFVEKCHCFVLPSWHEGMANTNLECGAMGRPIITSNIHGCLEAVVDGETGYLVESKNADDLYDKLKQFIELPYDKRVDMGRASHNHIAQNFDKKDVVRKTVDKIFSLNLEK